MGYFKAEKGCIYTTAPITKFYIPKTYFANKVKSFAEDNGSTIRVFGVFDVGFFKMNAKGEEELIEYNVLNLSTWIDVNVIDSTEETLSIKNEAEQRYVVLTYPANSNVMVDRVIKDSENAETFLGFIISGSLPHSIPYDKLLKVWQKNMHLNKASLGVQSVNLELVLSTSSRYAKNPSLKFSQALSENPNLSMYEYTMASAREVCRNTSTFTALTFEDLDSMMISSVNKSVNKSYEKESPLEELMKL